MINNFKWESFFAQSSFYFATRIEANYSPK